MAKAEVIRMREYPIPDSCAWAVYNALSKIAPYMIKEKLIREVEEGQTRTFWKRMEVDGKLKHTFRHKDGDVHIDMDRTWGFKIFVSDPGGELEISENIPVKEVKEVKGEVVSSGDSKDITSDTIGNIIEDGNGFTGDAYISIGKKLIGYVEISKMNDQSVSTALELAKKHKVKASDITIRKAWESVSVSDND
jgi:hypothetical protein